MYTSEEIEKMIKQYGDMVYRFAYVQVKNSHMADDIYQNVWLRLLKSKEKIDTEQHLKAWLLRTTSSCCKDVWKSFWYQKVCLQPEDDYFEEKSNRDSLMEDGYVTECVRRLPEKYRGIVHLYYYEGYRQKEIAELLGIKENTVASRLARGREKLKKIIESDRVENYEY